MKELENMKNKNVKRIEKNYLQKYDKTYKISKSKKMQIFGDTIKNVIITMHMVNNELNRLTNQSQKLLAILDQKS